MKYKPTVKGVVAVIVISFFFLVMGWMETRADTIVVLPSTNNEGHTDSKTIITPNSDGGSTMIHCLSSETGLVYCIEL